MNNKTREYRARTVVIDVANNKLVSSSHRCADDVLPTTVHCRVMLTEESLHTVLSSFFFFSSFVFSLLPCSLTLRIRLMMAQPNRIADVDLKR